MTDRWLSTRSALRLAVDNGVEPALAADQLLQALRAGDVQARATQLIDNVTEDAIALTALPPQFWQDAEPLSHTLSPMRLPHWSRWDGKKSDHAWIAIDVVVREGDIDRLWKRSGGQPSRGGRPVTHDWAAAAGFAAFYVAENDYPATQADLVHALSEWFDRRDKAPDLRELQRFVSAMYKAREA